MKADFFASFREKHHGFKYDGPKVCKEEVRDGIREEVGYYKDTSAYKKS